jgi:cardiolipin synthase A/B
MVYRPLGSWFLTCTLCVAGWVSSSADAADDSLRTLEHSTNLVWRAFATENRIRLYSTNDAQGVVLKAKWDRPRVDVREFSYASATLEPDTSSPPNASAPKWREARVLDRSRSEQVLRDAVEHRVSLQPGQGIYCRYSFGEAVVFRDAAGKIQIRPGAEQPDGVQIVGRYSRQELASGMAEAVEADLQSVFPNDGSFVLSLGGANQMRLAFIDLERRQAVVLYAPRLSNDPRRSAKLAMKLSGLASFIVVDNAWPLLKNPVSSITRTLNQGIQWSAGLFEPRLRKRGSDIPPLNQGPGMNLAAWEQWLDQHSHSERERGSVRLLIGGDQFFPLLEKRISEAQSKVDIHVCIFDRDDVAVEVADWIKRRSTNIEVKVIYDRLNSSGAGKAQPATPMPETFSPPRSIRAYLRSGGEVQLRPQPNPGFTCDHSKVFLVDTRYAYIGGMNLGREYRYEWHDMMAEVEGPVVASLQRQFDKKWAQVGLWGDCGLAAESLCGQRAASGTYNQVNWIELRRLYTKTFDRQIRRAELAAIGRACHHVYVENAYLYNNKMIQTLVRARLRGVDVRVVMPSDNDFGAGHKSNLVTANYLLQHGVRVYFYPGMSHIKALEVDGWACFGSANFDSLSLRLNREGDLATSDPGFAQSMRQELFERDFAKSSELKEPVATKFGDNLADALMNPF